MSEGWWDLRLIYSKLCCSGSRYTCPFVEKFSIDIETYYKTDPGDHNNVFNLSAAEKRQTILGE